jgi:hypothetical protein
MHPTRATTLISKAFLIASFRTLLLVLKEQGRALTLSARPRPSVHLNALDPGRVVIEL